MAAKFGLYSTPDGEFPSVTSILRKTLAPEKIEHFKKWEQEIGEEQAKIIKQNSIKRGSTIHSLIEAELYGWNMVCPEEFKDFWRNTQSFLKLISKVICSEKVVYSRSFGYAGKLDLLANYENELTLIDIKTSEKEKQSNWMQDEFLQIAAYQQAYQEMHHVEINSGLIAVVCPHTVQLFHFNQEEKWNLWETWLSRLSEYQNLGNYQENGSKPRLSRRL